MKRTIKNENKENLVHENKIRYFFNNPWKIAFLILAAIIIGGAVFLGSRIMTPRSNFSVNQSNTSVRGEPSFQVQLKKQQVNDILDYYLNDFMKKSGVDYKFTLDKEAMLEGTFDLLGHETDFYLFFEPYVLTNGNVQLRAKNLSVGTLSVPITAMINYISHSVDFPKWVEVDSKKQTITLHLDKYILKNGMKLRADKINLIDDEISFSVYLNLTDEKKGK
ncbi:YpmS family protein [Vagococcus vulneris]